MSGKIIYTEKELLKKIAQKCPSAFRVIFDQYRNRIYSTAFSFLKDAALAEDVVQEVFTKLWINSNKLTNIENLTAYITTITRNHVFNQLKRLAYAESFLEKERLVNDTNVSGIEAIEFNELSRQLANAVNKLPHQQKKVYQLGKIEGLKYEEIAGQLHISKETVKMHMSEAIKSVRSYLLKQEHIIVKLLLVITSIKFLFF